MCERLVGFCHLMRIVTLLSSAAGAVQSVKDLSGQSLLQMCIRDRVEVADDRVRAQVKDLLHSLGKLGILHRAGAESVSYTHLDVYKRQPQNRALHLI